MRAGGPRPRAAPRGFACSDTAATMSATRQAIASRAARARWPRTGASAVSPAITAFASGCHQGAPRPRERGSSGRRRCPRPRRLGRGGRGRTRGEAQVAEQPFQQGARREDAAVERVLPPPARARPRLGGGRRDGVRACLSRVREDEDARAVGGLDPRGWTRRSPREPPLVHERAPSGSSAGQSGWRSVPSGPTLATIAGSRQRGTPNSDSSPDPSPSARAESCVRDAVETSVAKPPPGGRTGRRRLCPGAASRHLSAGHRRRRARGARRACRPRSTGRAAGRCARAPRPRPSARAGRAPPASACPARSRSGVSAPLSASQARTDSPW